MVNNPFAYHGNQFAKRLRAVVSDMDLFGGFAQFDKTEALPEIGRIGRLNLVVRIIALTNTVATLTVAVLRPVRIARFLARIAFA